MFVDGVDDGDYALRGRNVPLDVVISGQNFKKFKTFLHNFEFLKNVKSWRFTKMEKNDSS